MAEDRGGWARVDRLERYAAVVESLALLSDRRLRDLLDGSAVVGTGIGGTSSVVHVGGTPVFVKQIPLTDLERRPEHSTRPGDRPEPRSDSNTRRSTTCATPRRRSPRGPAHPPRSSWPGSGTHSAPPVAQWLEHPKRARWHLHFTPTSSSWLNLVEGWFAQLTNRRLRHGSFDSVAALTEAINEWASHWNDDPKPFVWHKTTKAIITNVRRGRAALTHHTKSATHH